MGSMPEQKPKLKRDANDEPEERKRLDRSRDRGDRGSKGNSNLGPKDLTHLGPQTSMVSQREEREAKLARQKEEALASRGAPRRMTEEEKAKRLAQMRADANTHELTKDKKIADAERKEKEIERLEAEIRNSNQKNFIGEIRQEAYMESTSSMADRL